MLRLDERIPEHGFKKGSTAMLDAFLGWAADAGFQLYPHQEEAVLEIFSGNHVILDAPTGSGKSLVALALHFKSFAEAKRSWYTAPIKALVSEKFFALCEIFGPEFVGMMTGDGAVNRDAPILCCTAEILANLALREGELAKVDSVVMDEFHYYGDKERGMAWQIPLLMLPKTTFLLMSATLGDTTTIKEDLEKRTGIPVAEVKGVHRPVPLHFSYCLNPVFETIPDLIRENKAPVYVVHFTQNDASEQAQALMSSDFCSKEEKKALQEAIRGFRFHSPFGPTLKRYLLHGVGLHHAGLLPRYRRLVEKLAQSGLLKVICGTDTLGVGINVPIRTVLFTQLCKFDGEKTDILKIREFKQIAGRAGRAGFDTVGFVVAQAPAHVIENLRQEAKTTDPKKKKKLVKAQPPNFGYKAWDETVLQRLIHSPPESLESRFTLDHGRLLSLMQHAFETTGDARRGYEALYELIEKSHATDAQKSVLQNQAEALLQNLQGAGVVREDGYKLIMDPGLQKDFSLYHALSLFLIEAIANLDPTSESYALDVLSWVEAILENPRAILIKQEDREKQRKLMELKQAGVPYEDRITALEEISWPKPLADSIYLIYNAYREHHPWIAEHPIRPKGIARELVETFSSFADYIRDLGLTRSEGVLLRYLSEVYKALVQNVPADTQSDALVEIIGFFRAMLGLVDSSLLTEWEALISGTDANDTPVKLDISSDRKVFMARVRAELGVLVRALSKEDWEEAAGSIRQRGESLWTAESIKTVMEPFLEEFGAVGFDHRARLATNLHIKAVGPHQWELKYSLWPASWEEEEPCGWAIVGRIDLRDDCNPEGPLVEVREIS